MDIKKLFGLSEQQLARLTSAKLVKSASVNAAEPNYYADSVNKRFPLDTPQMILLSAAAFTKLAADMPEHRRKSVEQNILKAANAFAIDDEVKRMLEGPPAEPTSDVKYGLIVKKGNTVRKLYPMRSAAEVKRAAEYFVAHRHELPWHLRHQMAYNILDAAAHFETSLHDAEGPITKSACDGISSKDDALKQIRQRITWAKRTPNADILVEPLTKLAQAIEQHGGMDFSSRFSLVELLDRMDRAYKWNRYYDGNNMPEDALFGFTRNDLRLVKQAFVENARAGVIYGLDDITSKIPRDVLEAAVGTSTMARMTDDNGHLDPVRMSKVLAGPVGDTFHKLAAAHGVVPCGRIQSEFKFPDEVKRQLAAAHDRRKRASLWGMVNVN